MATLIVVVTPATASDGSAHEVSVPRVGAGSTDASGKKQFLNVAYGSYEVRVCGVFKGIATVNKPLFNYPCTCREAPGGETGGKKPSAAQPSPAKPTAAKPTPKKHAARERPAPRSAPARPTTGRPSAPKSSPAKPASKKPSPARPAAKPTARPPRRPSTRK